jgi:periplasmic divalent cation tolerance protein
MPSKENIVILTNCASRKEAQKIAHVLVEKRLAACVNAVASPVESIYRWKGKLETAKEFPLIIKTSRAKFAAVERAIREIHSYDVPEIIALPIVEGSRAYLSWLVDSISEKGKE